MNIDLGNILTKDAKGFMSFIIVFGSFLGMLLGMQWLSAEIHAKKDQTTKCWQIQQIDGTTYNHNACTGEIKKIELPRSKRKNASK